tara:strand:+ start:290 stop:493 length:204 start_codon:yes stop_codon:yes gene_type:complete
MNSRSTNKEKKYSTEANHYWPTRIRVDGVAKWILLTDAEVSRAAKRAEKNPEDMPGLWSRIRIVLGL